MALLARHGGAQVNGSGMSSNSPALIVLAMVPIIWPYVALARMLAGIHEIDGRLIAVVLTVAGLLTAFAPKSIDIPVWHAHVEIHHQADDWSIGWDLGNN